LHVFDLIAEGAMLEFIYAQLECEDHNPEHSVKNYNVLFAISVFDVTALQLKLVLGVDPKPIIKSLPASELPVHWENTLSGLSVRLSRLPSFNKLLELLALATWLVNKKCGLTDWRHGCSTTRLALTDGVFINFFHLVIFYNIL
jgi:hypothetical protein